MSEELGVAKSKSLSLLFLTSDKYPPFRPAAKAIFTDEFKCRGHKVDWLIQAEAAGHKGGRKVTAAGTVYLAGNNGQISLSGRVRKYASEFLNNLRILYLPFVRQYDLVQVKDRYFSATLALIAAKLSRTPYFYWLAYPHAEAHALEAEQGFARYPRLYRVRAAYQSFLLYRVILKFADHAFVQSEQMRRDIAAKGIDESHMTAVPGSVTLGDIPYKSSALAQLSQAETILYVGTLIRERHLEFLIQAFARTYALRPSARLRIVGKGENPEDEQLLRDEISRLGLMSVVELVGQLPLEDVFPEIANSAVCVSPYYPSWILNSTSPTKLIEYMAMGKPVVGNDHPEQTQVLELSGAGFVTPWDAEQFGERCAELLANPERSAEMGRAGRLWVEQNRTNKHLADVVQTTYQRVLANHGRTHND